MKKFIKLSDGGGGGVHPLRMTFEKTSHANNCAQVARLAEGVEHMDPRILKWIQENPIDHDKYTVAVMVPLGADESWEETVNGDAFERRYLAPVRNDWGHYTFQLRGRAHMHHASEDPSTSFGSYPLMVYSDASDRCEGIWKLDNEKAKREGAGGLIRAIRERRNFPISMGCKVPYDVCSSCGHKARTIRQHCMCTRIPGFGHIDPITGVKIRVFNPEPDFEETSGVGVNAAPEALILGGISQELQRALSQIAKSSSVLYLPDHTRALSLGGGLVKASSAHVLKISDMLKSIPMLASHVLSPIEDEEEDLPVDEIVKLASVCGSPEGLLATAGAMGIVLRPHEFSAALGEPETGFDELSVREGFLEDTPFLDPQAVSRRCAQMLSRHMPARSILLPHGPARMARALGGRSRRKPPVEIRIQLTTDPGLGKMYGAYLRDLAVRAAAQLTEQLTKLFEEEAPALMGLDGSVKLSAPTRDPLEMAAAAMLPAAYILNKASSLGEHSLLLAAVRRMCSGPTGALYGGLLQ